MWPHPLVPADGPKGDGGVRDAILTRYDRYRAIYAGLKTTLTRDLWQSAVAPIARRLGLVGTEEEAMRLDPDDLAAAVDLALYATAADGTTAVHRHVTGKGDRLPDIERQVLDRMCAAVFSIFRIEGCHRGAGVDLTDLTSGARFWVVDRSLEASAYAGTELALRLFRLDDFWIATGIPVVIDRQIWGKLEGAGAIRRQGLPGSMVDRDALAETIYRLALA